MIKLSAHMPVNIHQKFLQPTAADIAPAMMGPTIREPLIYSQLVLRGVVDVISILTIYTTQYRVFHFPRSWRKKMSVTTAGESVSAGPAPKPLRMQAPMNEL